MAVAAEPQLRSMTDAELYAWATAEGRRIVTENVKEFRRLLMQEGELTGPGCCSRACVHFGGVDVLRGRSSLHWTTGSPSPASMKDRLRNGCSLWIHCAVSTLRRAAARHAAAAESILLPPFPPAGVQHSLQPNSGEGSPQGEQLLARRHR
jgi:Domain of unknown function (DUF5615)